MPTSIAFFGPRGAIATPGYFIPIIPWASEFSKTGVWTRGQNSARLGGGIYYSGATQNEQLTWNMYATGGTFKIAMVAASLFSSAGIYTFKIAGSSVGTYDAYAAVGGPIENTYVEITGITVATGQQTFQMIAATKNAGSSGYEMDPNTITLLRTGA